MIENTPEFQQAFIGRLQELVDECYGARGLARKSGTISTNIDKYLKGDQYPGMISLINIAEGAGVRLEWFILGRGPKRNTPDPLFDIYQHLNGGVIKQTQVPLPLRIERQMAIAIGEKNIYFAINSERFRLWDDLTEKQQIQAYHNFPDQVPEIPAACALDYSVLYDVHYKDGRVDKQVPLPNRNGRIVAYAVGPEETLCRVNNNEWKPWDDLNELQRRTLCNAFPDRFTLGE